MDIIQRDNKFYLQLANGELELTEQQVKKRIERGDKLHEYLRQLEKEEPQHTFDDSPKNAQTFITSGRYFDNLIHEFEEIYRLSDDRKEAVEKLTRFCKNAINKLHHDRKNPKTDHIVIDYYILSWSRVIAFLQSLADTDPAPASTTAAKKTPTEEVPAEPSKKLLTRQLLVLQLMQADGLFPISNALYGISQDDILRLICNILNVRKEEVEDAILESSAILLKRNITEENKPARIHILEEMEELFEQLPYSNIISRIKLLLKIYKE